MSEKNLYLDIHVLQTVPPSCINRDDLGSPKTAVYGGVVRARLTFTVAYRYSVEELYSTVPRCPAPELSSSEISSTAVK